MLHGNPFLRKHDREMKLILDTIGNMVLEGVNNLLQYLFRKYLLSFIHLVNLLLILKLSHTTIEYI